MTEGPAFQQIIAVVSWGILFFSPRECISKFTYLFFPYISIYFLFLIYLFIYLFIYFICSEFCHTLE